MPTWPDSLPDTLELSGFTERLDEGAIRTKMDSGPAFQRQRYSATGSRVSGSITIDAAQYARLKEFYRFDCAQGSLAFDWKHPITDETANFRFVVGSPIQFSAVDGDHFRITLTLEILP